MVCMAQRGLDGVPLAVRRPCVPPPPPPRRCRRHGGARRALGEPSPLARLPPLPPPAAVSSRPRVAPAADVAPLLAGGPGRRGGERTRQCCRRPGPHAAIRVVLSGLARWSRTAGARAVGGGRGKTRTVDGGLGREEQLRKGGADGGTAVVAAASGGGTGAGGGLAMWGILVQRVVSRGLTLFRHGLQRSDCRRERRWRRCCCCSEAGRGT